MFVFRPSNLQNHSVRYIHAVIVISFGGIKANLLIEGENLND